MRVGSLPGPAARPDTGHHCTQKMAGLFTSKAQRQVGLMASGMSICQNKKTKIYLTKPENKKQKYKGLLYLPALKPGEMVTKTTDTHPILFPDVHRVFHRI